MKIYFAHPINTYGTPLETAILGLLAGEFPLSEVINPNTPEFQRMYEEMKASTGGTHGDHRGMDIFYRLLEELDGVVALPFLDRRMGLGVAGEAQKAVRTKRPVWLIEPSHELTPQELDRFITDPLSGHFRVRLFTPEEVETLRNHPGDLKDNPPAFVVPHEETRLRTFFQYNGAMRPYAEAHRVKMPPPPDFYALVPKGK